MLHMTMIHCFSHIWIKCEYFHKLYSTGAFPAFLRGMGVGASSFSEISHWRKINHTDGKLSKYKLRLSCSFMYLQLANLLLLNMCFEYQEQPWNRGTWIEALGRRLSNQRFLKTRFSRFFANGLITFINILRVVSWEVRYVQMVFEKVFNGCIITCIVEPWISLVCSHCNIIDIY